MKPFLIVLLIILGLVSIPYFIHERLKYEVYLVVDLTRGLGKFYRDKDRLPESWPEYEEWVTMHSGSRPSVKDLEKRFDVKWGWRASNWDWVTEGGGPPRESILIILDPRAKGLVERIANERLYEYCSRGARNSEKNGSPPPK